MSDSLEPGDIFAVKGERRLLSWLSFRFMAPVTDRFHFGLVWLKTADDYIILESITKGVAVGRLSSYRGQDVKFYRVNCPKYLRQEAPVELTRWGGASYDYFLLVKLIIAGIFTLAKILWKEHRLRRLKAEELRPVFRWDNRLICTEATWCGYNAVGVNIIPYGIPPLPSSFRDAELEGRMYQISLVSSKEEQCQGKQL